MAPPTNRPPQHLSIIHRIAQAVLKIGTNGTKIAAPEYTGEDQNNEVRSRWHDQHAAIAEYLVANTVAGTAETRKEKAKEKLQSVFDAAIAKLNIGDKDSHVRSNVSVEFNLRNGARRINRATIISTLSQAPYNWELAKVNELLDKIEVAGKPVLYISTSTTAD